MKKINTEKRIAGKTHDEIISMGNNRRCKWYKMILPKEKEKAIHLMENIRSTKISKAMMGSKNPMYGKTFIHTESAKVKMSIAKMGENNPMYGKMGENSSMYGKTFNHTKESRDKMRSGWTPEKKAEKSASMTEQWKDPEYRDKLSGENAYSWQDGKSFESYGVEFNNELKKRIRKRDNYTCQICGKIQELGQKLDVHHIDYDKTNNEPDNLISLCKSCHVKTNFNREGWMKYFKKKVED